MKQHSAVVRLVTALSLIGGLTAVVGAFGATPAFATTSTSLSTSLSDGAGGTGTSLTADAHQPVTDTAELSGTNASTAGGSVTYTVYTDDACTDAVPGSSSTVTVTDGSVPVSSPVALTALGTYYWQASYSGDAANDPSMSTCGSETETVATPKYWPSATLNKYAQVANGKTLTFKAKGFPPKSRVIFEQCNEESLDAPEGVFNSNTCDMSDTITATTTKKGTLSLRFKVDPNVPDIGMDCPHAHDVTDTTNGQVIWAWICGDSQSVSEHASTIVIANIVETWYSPQNVKITGLNIPKTKPATQAYVAECTSPTLDSCGPEVAIKAGKKETATLPVVMGSVGDGTCGTGSADEICYIVLGDPSISSSPLTYEPIDFYEEATGGTS